MESEFLTKMLNANDKLFLSVSYRGYDIIRFCIVYKVQYVNVYYCVFVSLLVLIWASATIGWNMGRMINKHFHLFILKLQQHTAV